MTPTEYLNHLRKIADVPTLDLERATIMFEVESHLDYILDERPDLTDCREEKYEEWLGAALQKINPSRWESFDIMGTPQYDWDAKEDHINNMINKVLPNEPDTDEG